MKKVINDRMELVPFVQKMEAFGFPFEVEVLPYENTRTAEQNRRMWAMLTDISQQVIWYGKKLQTEDWKDIFTAALDNMEVVPNLDGTGFVSLGGKTSKMTIKRMAELIELMFAFGSEHNVRWQDPSDILNYIDTLEKKDGK